MTRNLIALSAELPHHQVLAILATRSQSYLEIGVQDGDSLAAVIEANPAINLTLCDTWGPHHGGTNRGSHDHITRLLDDMKHIGERVYLDGNSVDLIPNLDQRFDLVHIDADHSYEGCKADLKNCWPLTEKWIVVHDLFFIEVRNAMFEFLEWHMHKISTITMSANDHGTMVVERRV